MSSSLLPDPQLFCSAVMSPVGCNLLAQTEGVVSTLTGGAMALILVPLGTALAFELIMCGAYFVRNLFVHRLARLALYPLPSPDADEHMHNSLGFSKTVGTPVLNARCLSSQFAGPVLSPLSRLLFSLSNDAPYRDTATNYVRALIFGDEE